MSVSGNIELEQAAKELAVLFNKVSELAADSFGFEFDTSDGPTCISLAYVEHSITAPNIRRAVGVYHRQQPDPFTWPDMVWNLIKVLWIPFTEVNKDEIDLESFIQMCRGNQNVS